jgi:predicted Zn-dependent protease
MRCRTIVVLALVLAIAPAAAPGCATNPLTGKKEFMLLSPEDELALGQQAAQPTAEELGGPYADPVIRQYVQAVGQRVAAEALKVSYPYEYTFDVLDTEMVNAFALPGGPIFVTRGLLFSMSDESQLAGVLAHEVTHVAARHSAQQISTAMGAQFILSVLGAAGGEGGGYAGNLAKIVGGLVSLKYSRSDETQADSYGVDFAVRAGYQPMALVHVMELFKRMEEEGGGGGPEFLRSHPLPDNRIENIRNIISQKYPGAATDPRFVVGREAYQKNVLSRKNLVTTYSKSK